MKKVAVILAGCGVFDGAEINEAVLTLLEILKQGGSYQCLAPNIDQAHVINHLTGEEMPETRNVLVEAARIARGDIIDVAQADPDDYSALILPGGFGVAKNLSDFAFKDVLSFAQAMHRAGKPVGLICIAPALAPLIFGPEVRTTIGVDADTAHQIERMGGRHVRCELRDIVIDEANRYVSTPAYMIAGNPLEASTGIAKLVGAVLKMA
jgi:enhancing lycopene biosynthesis protein 2